MNGLTNVDLGHLARLQMEQRKEEAKARRLGRAVRARRTSHPRRPHPVVTR